MGINKIFPTSYTLHPELYKLAPDYFDVSVQTPSQSFGGGFLIKC